MAWNWRARGSPQHLSRNTLKNYCVSLLTEGLKLLPRPLGDAMPGSPRNSYETRRDESVAGQRQELIKDVHPTMDCVVVEVNKLRTEERLAIDYDGRHPSADPVQSESLTLSTLDKEGGEIMARAFAYGDEMKYRNATKKGSSTRWRLIAWPKGSNTFARSTG
eukprot:gene1511-896_t